MKNLKWVSLVSLLLILLLSLTACGGGNQPEETNDTNDNKAANEVAKNEANNNQPATEASGSLEEGVDYIVGEGDDYNNVPAGYDMLTTDEIKSGWKSFSSVNYYELSYMDVKKLYGDKPGVYWEYENPGDDTVMTMYWYAEDEDGHLLSAWVKFNTPNGLENSSASMGGTLNFTSEDI